MHVALAIAALIPLTAAVPAVVFAAPSSAPSASVRGDEFPAPVDTITLKKRGKVIEGRIVRIDDDVIVIRQKSKHKEYEREDVESYVWAEEQHAKLYPRLRDAVDASSEDLQAMAEEFEAAGLLGEAELTHWMVLDQDPSNVISHEALGHRKKGKTWRAQIDKKWVRWDDLRERTADWGTAWELHTTHYDLRTNLPLTAALRCALDAETIFRHFYDHYGKELGLAVPTMRQELHVHGDDASYPGGGAVISMFLSSQQRVTFNAHEGYWAGDLIQRMVQQYFFASSFEMGKRSALPSFVSMGIYRNFAAMLNLVDRDSGALSFDPSRSHEADRKFHREDDDMMDLSRVLTLDTSIIFTERGERALAQSGTLVDYVMRGQDRKYAEAFAEFVQGALEGKGSPTHFKKILGIRDERDFVAAWGRYVGRE